MLVVYVPESHAEAVKTAMFDAGAGRIGAYDCCSWQTLGSGQFRPGADSDPFVGERGQLEQLPELRLELSCLPEVLHDAIAALRHVHPYEEPAFHYWRVQG